MKKRTVNKLLSFTLAAVMLFTLLPGVTVYGATKQKSDQPTVASTDVSAVVDMNGHTTVTITDSMVSDLIDQARVQAETDDRTANGVGIQLNAAAGAAAKIIAITITANAIERLNSEDVKLFALVTPLVNISFNAAAIKEINTQTTGDVTVTITPEDKLSDEVKGYIGSRPVYNVSVSYQKSGVTSFITDLKDGAVTLGIAYTPASDEKSGSLFAVYVPKSGKPELLTKSSYNDGHVILTSNTLSVYGVGYKTPAPVFTDTANHWAKDNIDFAVSRGLLSGTSDTAFSPDTAITRGMFITALGRLSGADMSGYNKSSFSDVAEGSYYLPYIQWAVENKIVSGVGNGKFAPDKTITRQEIAIMTANYAASAGYNLPVVREVVTYADNASISARAKAAVKALQQAGVMSGVDNNRFNPKGTATRADAATILRNFTELVIDTGTARGWSQNETGQWMYYNQSGRKVTGWLTTSSGWYYFDTNGKLAVSVSNSPTSSTYDSVTGTVTTEDNSGVSFIGWRLSSNGASYTDTDGFTNITKTGKFTVSSNGWYAVGIVDGVGNFSYTQIQITDISTASGGSSGGGSIGGGTTISVPSVPQSLTTTPGDGQVALTWTAPTSNGGSGITKYQVQKDSDTWVDVMSGLAYTFTGLTNRQSYTFQVRAVNSVGNSEAATTTATPQAAATVPSSPQNFTAIPGDGQVTITWTDPVNNGGSTITKYQYSFSTGADNWQDIPGSGTTTTSYVVTGLTNGTLYTFKVRAVNSVGSGMEAAITATPQESAPTISSITVSPATASVEKGTTQQFTAIVNGTNNPAQTVTWNIDESVVAGTSISTNGLFTVEASETALSLTVRATSTVDNTKSGTAIVTVSAASATLSVQNVSMQDASYGSTVITAGAATGNVSGSSVTVEATPQPGYTFWKWVSADDPATSAVSTSTAYTFDITSDTTLYAVFSKDSAGLGYTVSSGGAVNNGATATGNIVIPCVVDNKVIWAINDIAFLDNASITSAVIPDTVTAIGGSAFRGCTSLSTVTLPDSLQTIGDSAFNGCINLSTVTLLDSLQIIGDSAFRGCTSLSTVSLPDSLQTIGDSAFRGCTSLSTVTLLDGLQTIGDSAFSDCTSLSTVTLPDSIQEVGDAAFIGCTSLVSATFLGNRPVLGLAPFTACTILADIWYVDGKSGWPGDAFYISSTVTITPQPLTRMLLLQTTTLTLGTSGNSTAVHDDENGDTFSVGDTVTITTTPDEGYSFVEWRDETVSANAEYSFEIIEDVTLTAVFIVGSQDRQDGETDGGEDNATTAPETEPAILPQDEDDNNDAGEDSDNAPEDDGWDDGSEAIELM